MQIGSHMFYIWMNINLFIKESLLCFICTFNINRNKIILSLLICFIVLNLFIRFNIGNNLINYIIIRIKNSNNSNLVLLFIVLF